MGCHDPAFHFSDGSDVWGYMQHVPQQRADYQWHEICIYILSRLLIRISYFSVSPEETGEPVESSDALTGARDVRPGQDSRSSCLEASIQSNLVHWADEFGSDPSELSITGTREAGLLRAETQPA